MNTNPGTLGLFTRTKLEYIHCAELVNGTKVDLFINSLEYCALFVLFWPPETKRTLLEKSQMTTTNVTSQSANVVDIYLK